VITDISEFSYGFALTSELVDLFHLKAFGAPEFPNQYNEGKKGGGFDVKLPGIPIFLQFKRSDYLERKNAKDYKHFKKPYYRFGIRPNSKSKQHQLMLDLESRANDVFYAGPIFSKSHELDLHYINQTVSANSLYLRPSTIGPIHDNKPHTISFSDTGKVIYRSEPKYLERDYPPFLVESTKAFSLSDADTRTRRSFIEELVDIYVDRVGVVDAEAAARLREPDEQRNSMYYMAYISRNLFNCELLFV
jgi:hypothetical protein